MTRIVPSDQEINERLSQYLSVTTNVDVPQGVREIDAMSLDARRNVWRGLLGTSLVAAAVAATVVATIAAHQPPTPRVAPARTPVTTETLTPPPVTSPTATATPTAAATPAPSPAATVAPIAPAPDPAVAGWKSVVHPQGMFSFEVPASWEVSGPCIEPYPNGIPAYPFPIADVRTGPAAAACGNDATANLDAESWAGTAATDSDWNLAQLGDRNGPDLCFTITSDTPVIVDGVRGTRRVEKIRTSGVAIDPHTGGSIPCTGPGGEVIVEYHFIHAGRVFTISDTFDTSGQPVQAGQVPTSDQTATLDRIMTSTWKFTS